MALSDKLAIYKGAIRQQREAELERLDRVPDSDPRKEDLFRALPRLEPDYPKTAMERAAELIREGGWESGYDFLSKTVPESLPEDVIDALSQIVSAYGHTASGATIERQDQKTSLQLPATIDLDGIQWDMDKRPAIPPRKDWTEFASLTSEASVRPQAEPVNPDHLVDMADYKDGLDVFVAYAQDNHAFDKKLGKAALADKTTYDRTPRTRKVNKFGCAYKEGAKLWLHKDMAEIVAQAARFMQREYGWRSTLYDGLRTVEGAYNIYRNATDKDLGDGLLAPPGLSAHNKGMAADLVQFEKDGKLVRMGGNFDHLDMDTNSRNNKNLSPDVLENRRKREIAFQHAALSQGKLFAPLRSEFWDERFPENEADHWRVLESVSRCLGKTLLSEEDENNRKAPKGSPGREAFRKKWEMLNYEQFKTKWAELFTETELRATLKLSADVKLPPSRETIIYHGDFHPLYDRDLPQEKQLTDNWQELAQSLAPAKTGVYGARRTGAALSP